MILKAFKDVLKFFSHTFSQSRNQIAILVSLIVVITFISFSSSLYNEFTNWDDQMFVTENPLIKEISWKNIKIIFTSFYKEIFRQPLVLLSFSLEYHFFQLDPFIYHLNNLILHILNSLLVFYLIFMLSNKVVVSFITALLFGIHPLHVESVAWVSERKDVLSTFFYLQAIIYYLHYKGKDKWSYYYLSLVVFILALLSKAMAITLPFVLLLCDYLVRNGFNRKTFLEKVPFFAIGGITGVVNILVHKSVGAISSPDLFSPIDNLLIALRGIIFYLTKVILPINLSAFYPYPREISILMSEFFLPLIFLSILTIVVFYSVRFTGQVIFGSLFFLMTILPVLKLIPLGGGGAAMADRYMYIPSIGLFFIFGIAFNWVYTREGILEKVRRVSSVIFLSIVIFTFSVLTYQRNNIWQNSETLWADTIRKSPDSAVPRYNLGTYYLEKGMWDEAVAEYKEATRIDPFYTNAYYNLGRAYAERGMWDEAIAEYKKALRTKHDLVDAHHSLGVAYAERDMWDEAVAEYKEAIRIDPLYTNAHYNLGIAYTERGMWNEAKAEYKKALRTSPDLVNAHYNLGVAYAERGMWDEAIAEYREALRVNPAFEEAHYNLGIALKNLGQFSRAEEEFRETIRFAPDHFMAYNNLGNISLIQKRYGLAIKAYQEALRLNPVNIESIYNLAIGFERIGDLKGAMEFYKRFIEVAPQEYSVQIKGAKESIKSFSGGRMD